MASSQIAATQSAAKRRARRQSQQQPIHRRAKTVAQYQAQDAFAAGPRAMRTPISVVRCATMNDSTPNKPTIANSSDKTANDSNSVASKRASSVDCPAPVPWKGRGRRAVADRSMQWPSALKTKCRKGLAGSALPASRRADRRSGVDSRSPETGRARFRRAYCPRLRRCAVVYPRAPALNSLATDGILVRKNSRTSS